MTNAKPLLVVGAPRSGTKSFAEMFGIAHEVQFTPTTTELPAILHSESSWLMAPFIPQILDRGDDVRFVHAIRHPLRVAESLCNIGFWADDNPYRSFVTNTIDTPQGYDPLTLGVWLWCRWVEMVPTCPTLCIDDTHTAPWLNQSVSMESEAPTWDDVHDMALVQEATFLWGKRSGCLSDVLLGAK